MRTRAHTASANAQQQLSLPLCEPLPGEPHNFAVPRQAPPQPCPVILGTTSPVASPQFVAARRSPSESIRSERGVPLASVADPVNATAKSPSQPADIPEPGACAEWSDEAVAQLHEGLLHHSLALLRTRGNVEEKQEILRWIWAPSVFCWVSRCRAGVHQRIPIHRRELPFTFERCCAVAGLQPAKVRSGLAGILREQGLQSGIAFGALGIDIDS